MKVNILIIVLLIIGISLKAQNKYGYQWHFTNHNIMDFRNNTLLLDIIQPSPFYNTGNFSSNICDKETGELLFVSGGCYVLNKKFNIIKNGDSINSQLTYTSWCRVNAGDGTFPMYQNNIILPYPDSSSKYFLFNLDFDTINSPKLVLLPFHLYSNIIDISRENGLGEVIEKKKVIINDSLSTGGYLTAVRNKNDKDWWIIVPKWKTNCYFVIPVTSSGVGIPIKQCIGLNWQEIDRGERRRGRVSN